MLAAVAASQSPILVHALPPRDARGAAVLACRGGELDRDARREQHGSDAREAVARRVSVGPSDRFCYPTIPTSATPFVWKRRLPSTFFYGGRFVWIMGERGERCNACLKRRVIRA